MASIYLAGDGATYSGTIDFVFGRLIDHLEVHGSTPTIDEEAQELRSLWLENLGSTDRAIDLANVLGVTVTQ